MAITKYPVVLTEEERKILYNYVENQNLSAKQIAHANILLLSDRNNNNKKKLSVDEISMLCGVSHATVTTVRKQFATESMDRVLHSRRNRKIAKV